jgi:LSD1 subclass zinc finger protein
MTSIVGRLALTAALFAAGLAGCDGAVGAGDAGPPTDYPLHQHHPVGADHAGSGDADCGACHPLADQHDGQFALLQCVECHGTNGAPLLAAGHTGFGGATAYDCGGCHSDDPPHAAVLAPGLCAACHGGNGAPAVDLGHFVVGSGRVRCASCHPETTTHEGLFGAADCAGCHPVDGAPSRPDPHYVVACAECHGGADAPWNAATHEDTPAESPEGCALCHLLDGS